MNSEPKPAAPEPKEVVVWEGVVDGHHLVFSNINGELWEECVTIEHPHVLSLIAKRGLPIALLALHARAVAAEEKLAFLIKGIEGDGGIVIKELPPLSSDPKDFVQVIRYDPTPSNAQCLAKIRALCATFPVSAIDPAKLIEDIKKACDGALKDPK